jgi:hypothetical protein
MTNAEKYHYSDFTRKNYRRLLQLAKQKYTSCSFENYSEYSNFIIWRHDIDFSVHSSYALAKIEAEEGISSTFFVHLHNEFYNALEKNISELLKEILKLGHSIGLHFDSHYYSIKTEDSLQAMLLFEKEMLEVIVNTGINVFSFHNTTDEILKYNKDSYAGMTNTYSRYFREKTGYCSDSNGYWKHDRLEDILNSGKHKTLQVLTHPAWWQDEVLSPKQRIWRCIEGRAENTKKNYIDALSYFRKENIE